MHKLLLFFCSPQFQANFHVHEFLPLTKQSLFLVPLLDSDSQFFRMCRTTSTSSLHWRSSITGPLFLVALLRSLHSLSFKED